MTSVSGIDRIYRVRISDFNSVPIYSVPIGGGTASTPESNPGATVLFN